MKSLFVIWVLFFIPLFVQAVIPVPGLNEKDQRLVGQWVHMKSYCQNWNEKKIQDYNQRLREKSHYEQLFVNPWDLKFIQTQISFNTPKPPFEFCYREIYFRPISTRQGVVLKEQIVKTELCPIDSNFIESPSSLFLTYRIKNHSYNNDLILRIRNWPGCHQAPFVVYLRSK